MITPSIQSPLSIWSIPTENIILHNASFEDWMFDEIVFEMKKKKTTRYQIMKK